MALGGVLLSTGGLAAVSAAFAVHMALGVWWPFALLVGLGWGAVIVNLDRMVLVGMGHDSSLKRNLVLAVPRVGLALILGIVVATPLTLQIFHKEIDTEIVADAGRAGRRLPGRRSSRDARFADLPALRERIATAESIVATGGQTDAGLAVVQGEVTARQADAGLGAGDRRSSSRRRRSASSTARAAPASRAPVARTWPRGRRPTRRRRSWPSARSALDDAVDAASAAEARSAQLAGSTLDDDKATLARLTAEQDRLQTAFDATNEGSGGILLRLEALDRLGDENGTLAAAQFMLSLLFMSVEILPVLMKLLLNFSPPSAYDRLAALRDTGDVEIEELAQESRLTVAKAKEELLVLAEHERVDRQKQAVSRAGGRRSRTSWPAGRWRPRSPRAVADVGHRADPRAGEERRRPDGAVGPSSSRRPGAGRGLKPACQGCGRVAGSVHSRPATVGPPFVDEVPGDRGGGGQGAARGRPRDGSRGVPWRRRPCSTTASCSTIWTRTTPAAGGRGACGRRSRRAGSRRRRSGPAPRRRRDAGDVHDPRSGVGGLPDRGSDLPALKGGSAGARRGCREGLSGDRAGRRGRRRRAGLLSVSAPARVVAGLSDGRAPGGDREDVVAADDARMASPLSGPTGTSVDSPRMVLVIGATVTRLRWGRTGPGQDEDGPVLSSVARWIGRISRDRPAESGRVPGEFVQIVVLAPGAPGSPRPVQRSGDGVPAGVPG